MALQRQRSRHADNACADDDDGLPACIMARARSLRTEGLLHPGALFTSSGEARRKRPRIALQCVDDDAQTCCELLSRPRRADIDAHRVWDLAAANRENLRLDYT